MSYITEAVVWADGVSNEVLVALEAPLPFDDARGQSLGQLDADAAGGSKLFCSGVFAAAFNYVDGHDLEEWFKSLPWGTYDRAHLLWSTEGSFEGRVSVGTPFTHGWDA